MVKAAIANTSCLIALDKLNLIDLLCKIYDEIHVPSSVLEEFGEIKLACIKVIEPY